MSSVSVVIPCYNYGHFLEQAVSSVLDEQGDLDVRVLIIDDASPDGSGEVAQQMAARDSRVETVLHRANAGHIASYNEGLLGWADGDYSVLLSADDRVTPGALVRAVELLDAHPEVGFAYGNVLWFKEGAPLPRARTRRPSWSIWPGRAWLERRFRHGRSGISSPEVVVRTELQKQVGGYDPRMPHLGDTQMWLRMAARADVGYLRGVDQAYYRRHPDNMSSGYTQAMTLEQHLFVFESVLDECAETPDERKRLSDLVRRKAAWDALETAARAYDRGRTADTPVEELVAFALRSWPAARSFPIYHTLQARRRIGPRAVPYLRPLVMPALAARKAESWWLGLPAVRPLLSSGTWERYR